VPAKTFATSQAELLLRLGTDPELLQRVFDALPNAAISIKDAQARYLLVNNTLVLRSGLQRDGLIGLTSDQVFLATNPGGDEQSLAVVRSNVPVIDRLRMYAAPGGERYWCLVSQYPINDPSGAAIGLISIARDLPRPDEKHNGYRRLLSFSKFVEQHLSQKILIAKVAKHAGISVDALERSTKQVFHLTPKQLLMKMRVDRACWLLEKTDDSITDIAIDCGYSDHSAFTRQFKSATHLTPRSYRASGRAAQHDADSTEPRTTRRPTLQSSRLGQRLRHRVWEDD